MLRERRVGVRTGGRLGAEILPRSLRRALAEKRQCSEIMNGRTKGTPEAHGSEAWADTTSRIKSGSNSAVKARQKARSHF